MSFFECFRLPRVRFLSVMFGVMMGLPMLFLSKWQYAVLVGVASTFLCSIILPIILYREERAYKKIKDTIGSSFLIDQRVSFTVKNGAIGGFLILTDKNLILLSLEKGSHRLELSRNQIQKIVVGNEMTTISIYISNTQFIQVFSLSCQEMYRTLLDNGWGGN